MIYSIKHKSVSYFLIGKNFFWTLLFHYYIIYKLFSSQVTVFPVLTPTFLVLLAQLLSVLKFLTGSYGELPGLHFRWRSVSAELEKVFSLVCNFCTAARTPIDKRWPAVEGKHQGAPDSPWQKSGTPSKIYLVASTTMAPGGQEVTLIRPTLGYFFWFR